MVNKNLVLWLVASALVAWAANKARPMLYNALKDLTS
jgi:hypothetical protein